MGPSRFGFGGPVVVRLCRVRRTKRIPIENILAGSAFLVNRAPREQQTIKRQNKCELPWKLASGGRWFAIPVAARRTSLPHRKTGQSVWSERKLRVASSDSGISKASQTGSPLRCSRQTGLIVQPPVIRARRCCGDHNAAATIRASQRRIVFRGLSRQSSKLMNQEL